MSEVKVTVAMPGYNPLATPEAIESYIATLSRQADLSEDQKAHIRERRCVTQAQYQAAHDARERARADAGWRNRFFQGGRTEKSEWQGWNIILGSKLQG